MTLTNILECENNFTSTFIAEGLEVGKHFYWEIGGYTLHGQVFIISWLVIFLLILFSFLGTNNLTEVPRSWQNFMEFLVFKGFFFLKKEAAARNTNVYIGRPHRTRRP